MVYKETLSIADKETISKLILELATELDLHYDDEDMFALSPSFHVIKDGIKLLERFGHPVHPDVKKVIERFNKSCQ